MQSKNKDAVFFDGTVNNGDIIVIDGNGAGVDDQGTVGAEVSVYINGQFHVNIHTSCSVPIGIGQNWGDFKIVEGMSRNNGDLCQYIPAACPDTPTVLGIEVPCWAVDAVNFVMENELFSIRTDKDIRDAVKYYRLYNLIMGR
jgi:hypothetical protein